MGVNLQSKRLRALCVCFLFFPFSLSCISTQQPALISVLCPVPFIRSKLVVYASLVLKVGQLQVVQSLDFHDDGRLGKLMGGRRRGKAPFQAHRHHGVVDHLHLRVLAEHGGLSHHLRLGLRKGHEGD